MTIEHWTVRDERLPGRPTFVVTDADEAERYRSAGAFAVEGPFVPADHLTGAVEALRDLLDAASSVTQVRNGAAAESWHKALVRANDVVSLFSPSQSLAKETE